MRARACLPCTPLRWARRPPSAMVLLLRGWRIRRAGWRVLSFCRTARGGVGSTGDAAEDARARPARVAAMDER